MHCAAAAGNAASVSPPAPAARDVSLLHIGAVSALFTSTSASPLRPVPLPLGPAYNTSAAFAAAWNVSAAWALDDPAGLRANETVVGALVRAFGTAFYPSGALFEARHGPNAWCRSGETACASWAPLHLLVAYSALMHGKSWGPTHGTRLRHCRSVGWQCVTVAVNRWPVNVEIL